MANNAHFNNTGATPVVIVRDDRGSPVIELELSDGQPGPEQADERLRTAGWTRSADWTAASDGYVAPVVPS